jgi:hypothetical protein
MAMFQGNKQLGNEVGFYTLKSKNWPECDVTGIQGLLHLLQKLSLHELTIYDYSSSLQGLRNLGYFHKYLYIFLWFKRSYVQDSQKG